MQLGKAQTHTSMLLRISRISAFDKVAMQLRQYIRLDTSFDLTSQHMLEIQSSKRLVAIAKLTEKAILAPMMLLNGRTLYC